MPNWTIVLSSAIAAIVVVAGLVAPDLTNAPRSEIGTALMPHLPALAVGALGVYGLCAMGLTTTSFIAGILRMRYHLARAAPGHTPRRQSWIATVGTNGFGRLVTALTQAGAMTADDGTALPAAVAVGEVRKEIARAHYIALARSHFLSVLIVLAGIVGLGAAQDHGSLPFQTGTIPTVSALLIVAGLILLAVLGRIAIDVIAEPLLETIGQPIAEPVEVGLLRRVVTLLEAALDGREGEDKIGAPATGLPEQLVAAFEQGHRSLLDAVSRMSEDSQALEAALRASVEALDTAMRSTAAQQRLAGDDKTAAEGAFPELQAAVEELTAVLRRLSAVPEQMEETALAGETVPSRRQSPAPGLARELQRLLQEIDTAR